MHSNPPDDSALSPVIGEMMMIALALLLVSLFSVTLLGLLPAERGDSIDISINNSTSGEELTFWHKGGDWIKKSDLKVVIIRQRDLPPLPKPETISSSDGRFKLDGDSFDLGDRMTIEEIDPPLRADDIVRLINDKNVIYSGVIG